MGLKALLEKLNKELLSTAELTEARVVYMLVCARKLMELSNQKGRFPSLNFYCNWALHSKLTRRDAIDVIKLFDNVEDAVERADIQAEHTARMALHRTIYGFNLGTDFESFLKVHGLPSDVLEPGRRWLHFLDVYSRIIHDVPLEFTFTRVRHISKVSVEYLPQPNSIGPDWEKSFGLKWSSERFDGKNSIEHPIRFNKQI
jgi:hypothetical protein